MNAEFTWNHRVVKRVDPYGDVYYQLAEVTYTDDVPDAFTPQICNHSETVEGIQEFAQRLLNATKQPVLDERDIKG